MPLQVLPRLSHEAIGERVGLLLVLELQHEALAQVSGAHARRVELLDDAEHLLGFGERIGLDRGRLRAIPCLGLGRVLFEQLVRPLEDLFERGTEVAVFGDVAEELLGEELLARRQIEHPHLLAQVVDQILGLDRHRLYVFHRLAHVPGRDAEVSAVVEQDVFPVGLVVARFFGLGLRLLRHRHLGLLFGLDQLEEGITEQLLLQMLLEVEQRHVEEVHRLVQARVDAQLLTERRVLVQAGLHAAWVRRARRRAVRVGPRYRSATRSLNTSSRTVPDTWTLPSNMMYARSTMSRVCSTL